ncbi:MAG: deoxyribonuclease V [Gammaproteobacteria bacterium]|nr:deoxyribonuclease V [Gammaproteobacteria bacterium]NNF60672.1 deoxyribonuclease V [Gammaproteobacteria bacterium]
MRIPAAAFAGLDVTTAQALAVQQRLHTAVVRSDRRGRIRLVAGLDLAFPEKNLAQAAAVVISVPQLEVVEQHVVRTPVRFPYVPGLLSFRELPALLEVLRKVSADPDVIMCDGQGIAHPRRFGLASHLGVLLDVPCIGVAKSRLVGEHAAVPDHRGGWVPLCDKGQRIGAVLRTRERVRPLFVSVGHRISLRRARRLVLRCAPRYRLPEPTRLADKLSRV